MPNWNYVLLKPAQRFLKRMSSEDQRRVLAALDDLVKDESELLDIKPLQGRPELRLRVGKYRVLFVKDRDNRMYVVTTIGSRGDIYK